MGGYIGTICINTGDSNLNFAKEIPVKYKKHTFTCIKGKKHRTPFYFAIEY
jgi:hypothetical protein